MIAVLLLACQAPTTKPVVPPRPPPTSIEAGKTNVLLILLDTVRADHLGTYGFEVPTSPHLDALAESGVVFEQHIANSSWTRPSMASLLTGYYPRTLGIYEERFDALSNQYPLLSQHFQQHGYTTLGVTSNPNLNRVFGFVEGWTAYGESGVVFRWMDSDEGEVFNRKRPLEDASVMTDRALAMLDSHQSELRQSPFFLQVVYIDPHWPYVQPAAHEAAVKGSKKPGYDGGIHFIDSELKRLLNTMEARGQLHDTLVVITGDHGEGLDDHRFPNTQWHGNTLYETNLHVPLIVAHPSLPAHRVGELTEGLDLVPTLLDVFGWDVPASLPGKSLAGAIKGEGPPPGNRVVIAETDFRTNLKIAARTATHKYIRNDDVMLFKKGSFEGSEPLPPQVRQALRRTPPEEIYAMNGQTERPDRPQRRNPTVLSALRQAIADFEKAVPRAPPVRHDPDDAMTMPDGRIIKTGQQQGEVELDQATQDALKALGYLD